MYSYTISNWNSSSIICNIKHEDGWCYLEQVDMAAIACSSLAYAAAVMTLEMAKEIERWICVG
jgi:hypothetical protein